MRGLAPKRLSADEAEKWKRLKRARLAFQRNALTLYKKEWLPLMRADRAEGKTMTVIRLGDANDANVRGLFSAVELLLTRRRHRFHSSQTAPNVEFRVAL